MHESETWREIVWQQSETLRLSIVENENKQAIIAHAVLRDFLWSDWLQQLFVNLNCCEGKTMVISGEFVMMQLLGCEEGAIIS